MPRWPWSKSELPSTSSSDQNIWTPPQEKEVREKIKPLLLDQCPGVKLVGVIAQARSRTITKGVCYPIAANYVASWIDSIRHNDFKILENYRKKVFQTSYDPEFLGLCYRNQYDMLGQYSSFTPPEDEQKAESLLSSMYRYPDGEVKYKGLVSRSLFSQAATRFQDPGIYFIALKNHAIAFVNYCHPEGGMQVPAYRFLDANTGEFAWNAHGMTGQFFRVYGETLIHQDVHGRIKYVVRYPLQGYPEMSGGHSFAASRH